MKRFLAMVLSLAMILTFIPSVFATGEEATNQPAGITVKYSFMSGPGYSFSEKASAKDVKFDTTNGFWEYRTRDAVFSGWGCDFITFSGGKHIEIGTRQNGWMAIEIDVPKAGLYDVILSNVLYGKAASIAGLWILPASTENSAIDALLTENTMFGDSFSYHYTAKVGQNASYGDTVNLGEKYFTEGKHLIIYKSLKTIMEDGTIATSPVSGSMRPSGITLDGDGEGVENAVLMSVKADIDKTELKVGDATLGTAQMTVSGAYMSIGTDATGYTVEYTSSDEEVASVDENGKITAKAYGNATITATATLDGVSVESSKDITVAADGVSIEYNIGTLAQSNRDNGFLTALKYETTDGFYNFIGTSTPKDNGNYIQDEGETHSGLYFKPRSISVQIDNTTAIAVEVYIPRAGSYTMKMKHNEYHGGGDVNVYKSTADTLDLSDLDEETYVGKYDCRSTVTGNNFPETGDSTITGFVFDEPGYYAISFKGDVGYGFVGDFSLTSGVGAAVPMYAPLTIAENKATVANTVVMSDKTTETLDNTFAVTYDSSNKSVATVATDGTITKVGNGTTEITAKISKNGGMAISKAEYTVTGMEDSALSGAFDATINKNVSYTAPEVTGVTVDGGVIKSANSNGTFTLTADAEKNGNKFLYWAKGKTLGKKIISFSNELTNYMPEANDKNHILIAVYEGDVPEQDEWYNANGQRIATGTKPEKLPSMAGYGEAEGWDDYTDKIHVARYARQTPTAGINVTVKGENTTGGGTNLTYGDTVTCTATGENFKCWTKTGINGDTEIVSMEETYKFQAWETCTVEAIYQDDYTYNGNRMKIILDVFDVGNEKAVMAEFTGFGSKAVEKGIIWNGKKIAMTKPGTQFTLTGNVGDTFTGYAIVDNDNGTHSEITDGSVTIAE